MRQAVQHFIGFADGLLILAIALDKAQLGLVVFKDLLAAAKDVVDGLAGNLKFSGDLGQGQIVEIMHFQAAALFFGQQGAVEIVQLTDSQDFCKHMVTFR